MRSMIAVCILFLSSAVNGQVPHIFQNGQAANADKVNENFEYLLENAGGGCSATQQDNSVLISCPDGTSGVIAGAGTVVLVPEGAVGDTPNVDISVGEIFVVDADDVVLGTVYRSEANGVYLTWLPWSSPDGNSGGQSFATIQNQDEQIIVTTRGGAFYYASSDCSGQPFTIPGLAYDIFYSADDASYYVTPYNPYFDNFLAMSFKELAGGPDVGSDGGCHITEQILRVRVPITYTFPEELINAAYPVRLKQF